MISFLFLTVFFSCSGGLEKALVHQILIMFAKIYIF